MRCLNQGDLCEFPICHCTNPRSAEPPFSNLEHLNPNDGWMGGADVPLEDMAWFSKKPFKPTVLRGPEEPFLSNVPERDPIRGGQLT